jgi:uncharacterized repeat protein (TIGR03809 family)
LGKRTTDSGTDSTPDVAAMVDGQAYRLAEKRRDYYLEMQRNGRWKRYYSEAKFALQLREANAVVDFWLGIIDPAVVELPDDRPAPILPPRRDAA